MAKMDNMRLLACCANGAGSSLMMEKAIEKVMKKYGIKFAGLRHCAISEGKSAAKTVDVVFCSKAFAKNFDDAKAAGVVIVPLKNVMSDKEIEASLKELGMIE